MLDLCEFYSEWDAQWLKIWDGIDFFERKWNFCGGQFWGLCVSHVRKKTCVLKQNWLLWGLILSKVPVTDVSHLDPLCKAISKDNNDLSFGCHRKRSKIIERTVKFTKNNKHSWYIPALTHKILDIINARSPRKISKNKLNLPLKNAFQVIHVSKYG